MHRVYSSIKVQIRKNFLGFFVFLLLMNLYTSFLIPWDCLNGKCLSKCSDFFFFFTDKINASHTDNRQKEKSCYHGSLICEYNRMGSHQTYTESPLNPEGFQKEFTCFLTKPFLRPSARVITLPLSYGQATSCMNEAIPLKAYSIFYSIASLPN